MNRKNSKKKLRELGRKLLNLVEEVSDENTATNVVDPNDSNSSFPVLDLANKVHMPFGPVVTDWHYPMYPASLITNLRNAPYPYSQAYAAPIDRLTPSLFGKLPKTLYCGIESRDIPRLLEDGIRVNTPLYPSPRAKSLRRYSLILEIPVTKKLSTRIMNEQGVYTTIALIKPGNYHVYEKQE